MGYTRQQVAGLRRAAAMLKITLEEYILRRSNGAMRWCRYHKEWLPVKSFQKGSRSLVCRKCCSEQRAIKMEKERNGS